MEVAGHVEGQAILLPCVVVAGSPHSVRGALVWRAVVVTVHRIATS